jgi:hypothetical protein
MTQRVRTHLKFKAGGFARKPSLDVVLPETCDEAMQRDGIDSKPRAGTGEKTWWLIQLVAAVPLVHWQETAPPADWLDAASRTEWDALLLEGWAWAAARQQDAHWSEALLDRALRLTIQPPREEKQKSWQPVLVMRLLELLLPVLTNAQREAFALSALHAQRDLTRDDAFVLPMLEGCRHAWSAEFSRAVLERMRRHARKRSHGLIWHMHNALHRFALHVQPALVAEAEQGWPRDDEVQWPLWQEAVDGFLTVLQFRHDMLKEINP